MLLPLHDFQRIPEEKTWSRAAVLANIDVSGGNVAIFRRIAVKVETVEIYCCSCPGKRGSRRKDINRTMRAYAWYGRAGRGSSGLAAENLDDRGTVSGRKCSNEGRHKDHDSIDCYAHHADAPVEASFSSLMLYVVCRAGMAHSRLSSLCEMVVH